MPAIEISMEAKDQGEVIARELERRQKALVAAINEFNAEQKRLYRAVTTAANALEDELKNARDLVESTVDSIEAVAVASDGSWPETDEGRASLTLVEALDDVYLELPSDVEDGEPDEIDPLMVDDFANELREALGLTSTKEPEKQVL